MAASLSDAAEDLRVCGIAGIVDPKRIDTAAKELVHRMCDAMVHRGPDDEGYFFSSLSGLGIRRLSIIDLQTGHQPILNETGTIAVVLNGEIYNYRELRRDLEQRGHRFATQGDTETIVHGYEEYGDDCVQHLRGMFCFALWDESRKRLLLARDRAGIKQLYYSEVSGALLFGSEIKCILQSPSFSPRINPQSLAGYLTFLYAPSPSTMYDRVSELPPAHYLTWENGKHEVRAYWQLRYQTDEGHPESYYVEGLLNRLTDAVRSHLVSDVPLGAFLSGGIDSGLVAALMAKASNRPVETFTVGFEGKYGLYDERKDARTVAHRYRTNHREFLVKPDLADVLPRIIKALDQPIADSSAVPNYYICELARRHVTVALSGMGGDEVGAGYERYLGILLGKRYRALPSFLRRAVAGAVRPLPDWGGGRRLSAARLKRFVESAERDMPRAYLQLLSTFNTSELKELLVGPYRDELQHFAPEDLIVEAFHKSASGNGVNQMLYADITGYLAGDLLPLTDRMSMAHSLEVRVPFLDHELLEFAASVPPQLKIHKLTTKYILRKVGENVLPSETIHGQKRGFSIPLSFWLRGELRSFAERELGTARLTNLGMVDPKRVSSIMDEHFSGRANHENKIWALLIFVLWHNLSYAKEESSSLSR